MKYYKIHTLLLISLVVCSPFAQGQKTPQQQLETLRVPDGFAVTLFASEPMITNPSAIDIDTHGRVWVAEIEWYRAKAKQPPADKIKVLEDTNGDGTADKMTIFAEGIFAPMSICVAGTKVYVATSPDLWVFEDNNGDLKADGPPHKLLTGFGGFNHDHGAHSLVLGPDHKWWMSHGDTGFNVTGTDGSHIQYRWGAMLRGELDGSKLETVAVNFRNPYELCVSSFGECYFSDNDNDGNESVRAGWVLEGGNYGWYGSPPGPKGHVPADVPFSQHWHFRGHIPGNVPATLVTGFGSPCGICFYEGDAFGPKLKNAPLHCDAGPREVRIYRHELQGYGMKATSENLMTTDGDNYFRPDDICAAPDGSLFIADWYDGGVGGHAYNDPDRGRIFRLAPKGKKLDRVAKPGPYSNIGDAANALRSPNLATQFLAREYLLAQADQSIPILDRMLGTDPDKNLRARAAWLLDRIGPTGRRSVVQQLESSDPSFRALAVRILRRHANVYLKQILAISSDPSPEVRREVLLGLPSALQADADTAIGTLAELAATYDGSDRYQLEAINVVASKHKKELYARLTQQQKYAIDQLPLLALLDPKAAAESLVQRLDGIDKDPAASAILQVATTIPSQDALRAVVRVAANSKIPVPLRQQALQKLDFGLSAAWKPFAEDAQAAESLRQAIKESVLQSQVLELTLKYSIKAILPDVLRLASAPQQTSAVRNQAIRVISQLRPEDSSEVLGALLGDADLSVRDSALNALILMQDLKTVRAILLTDTYSGAVRSRAIERLMSNTGGALVLLRMLDSNKLPESVATEVVSRAINHPDSSVRTLYDKHIPAGQRPKTLGEAIKAADILALAGNATRGEQVFFQSSAAQCVNCHSVHGKGATVGPDLSQIGKKYERATLLETILEPSKAIAPEYITYLLETERGQVFAGFLVEQTDRRVILKDPKGELVSVGANEVIELAKTARSAMPDLVLRDVTAQDAADLLAFLTTLKQGSQSIGTFRVVGPFDNPQRSVDAKAGPEESLANPNLNAEFPTLDAKKVRWELVTSESSAGFPAIDTVRFDRTRGFRANSVSHYFLAYAESPSEQDATLLIGSDDGCKVWINGQQVHRNEVTRALGFGQDRVPVRFKAGRNVILIKVVNGDGAGGLSLGVSSSDVLQLKTD